MMVKGREGSISDWFKSRPAVIHGLVFRPTESLTKLLSVKLREFYLDFSRNQLSSDV